MKKTTTFVVTLVMAILLAGCGQSPKSTAKSFLENLAHGKITEAKKYATEQTGKILDIASTRFALEVNPNYQFIFVEQSVDGNKAIVKYKEAKDGKVHEIDLVKVDGQWKVHLFR
jgi:ABC-type glycerol-3-phosphate transport system substrate-binding protein